jgi:hypothetical protein
MFGRRNKNEEEKQEQLLANIRKAVQEAEAAGFTVFVDEFYRNDQPSGNATLVYASMIRLVTHKKWWGGR